MTTAAHVKRMVQPVLDRNADLELVGRWIFVKPVHHFARAILIDRTAYATHFDPRWMAIHLFQARKSFSINWSEYLANERSPRRGVWRTFDPDVQLALVEAIEQQALPRLRAIKTLDDYLSFVSQHRLRHQLFDWPECKIIVDVALGNLEMARKICRDKMQKWSVDNPDYDEEDRAEYHRVTELCTCLMADDRVGLVRLLHEWEALTVQNLKIEHLWEPTPFPLELQEQDAGT